MKKIFLAAIALLASPSSFAADTLLLDCQLDIAPLSHVRVISTERGLEILEKRLGYSFTSRPLEQTQWEARELRLEDPQDEIHGMLWKVGANRWNYKFQRSDGWQMSSGAACYEAK